MIEALTVGRPGDGGGLRCAYSDGRHRRPSPGRDARHGSLARAGRARATLLWNVAAQGRSAEGRGASLVAARRFSVEPDDVSGSGGVVVAQGATLVLDDATLATALAEVGFESGDTSKPYRYIPLFAPGVTLPAGASVDDVNAARLSARVLEQLPLSRERFALTLRYAHRFTQASCHPVQDARVSALGDEAPGVPTGPLHRPCQPCLVCHDGAVGDAPASSVAGAVYLDATSLAPVSGGTVTLTGADGATPAADPAGAPPRGHVYLNPPAGGVP